MLCSLIKPDRVIVVKSNTFLQMQKQELASVVKASKKVILLWDDVDRAYEFSQLDLFPTVVGMCEELQKTGVVTIATCRSGITSLLEGYRTEVFWRRFLCESRSYE